MYFIFIYLYSTIPNTKKENPQLLNALFSFSIIFNHDIWMRLKVYNQGAKK